MASPIVISIGMLIIAVLGMISVFGCVMSMRKNMGLWGTLFFLGITFTFFPFIIYDVITDIIWWARVL